jgi:hypothetical protein
LQRLSPTPADPLARPFNVIVIDWAGERITRLRDFHHAPYALEEAPISIDP